MCGEHLLLAVRLDAGHLPVEVPRLIVWELQYRPPPMGNFLIDVFTFAVRGLVCFFVLYVAVALLTA